MSKQREDVIKPLAPGAEKSKDLNRGTQAPISVPSVTELCYKYIPRGFFLTFFFVVVVIFPTRLEALGRQEPLFIPHSAIRIRN